jgi:hypothetical protein
VTIQRAVVKGILGDLVQTRNLFTADVVESGGDTFAILWDAYLQSIYDEVEPILSITATTISAELQNYTAGDWITFDELEFVNSGSSTAQALANAVAFVLIGKAPGKRKMGRKFFSGLTEDTGQVNTLADSVLSAAALTLLAYITPFTGIGGGTITPGILDKDGSFKAFVGGVVSSYLGSMRRRKPGIGI